MKKNYFFIGLTLLRRIRHLNNLLVYQGIVVVDINININIITMPGSSPHVRAKSKRKKDARQSLADSGRNVQAKDRLAKIPRTTKS